MDLRRLAFLWLVFILLTFACGLSLEYGRPYTWNQQRQDCLSSLSLRENVNVTLYIAVSSLLLPIARRIELHWRLGRSFSVQQNDHVMLTNGNPTSRTSTVLERVHPGSSHTGSFRTWHRYYSPNPGQEDMSSRCTQYWISYWRAGQIIASNCLMLAAAWMNDNRSVLSKLRLSELLLPGTHNSGTYRKALSPINKLLVNQHEDIWTQLMFGVRYIDLRVGYRQDKNGDQFWINHDVFKVRPIEEVLHHIKLFMERSQEVLIVDFHRFPQGFNNQAHDRFVRLLKSQWSQWMLPHGADTKLASMWNSNQRLMVTYANDRIVLNHPELWPNVRQEWGDKRRPTNLFAYLRGKIAEHSNRHGLWALMAELTPRTIDLFLPNHGLRDLAQLVNTPLVNLFLDEQWWKTANIVATDFFLGNDMIRISIEANRARASCLP